MTRKESKRFSRDRKGYTLVEMLIVVAILVALLGVALFSIVTIQKQLRQKELDSKAETIYMAAQSRMAELCAAGYEELYKYEEGTEKGISQVGLVPSDVAGDTEIEEDTLCYVEAAKGAAADQISLAAADILPEGLIDEELRSNQWHIEYDPGTGCVYGVFYSEDGTIPSDKNELDNLRSKKQRLKAGATVGYYGGDLTGTETTDTLQPGITIENKEELKAIFYCNNPSSTEQLTFKITLTDADGNSYEKTIEHASLERVSSRMYRYTWTLDSLKSDKTRFYAQTEGKLACGTKLTVKLSVSSTDNLVDTAETERTTNSLFDYRDGSDSDTAYVSYARHLQNLDEVNSHVANTITKAVQTNDISFADDESNEEDWYSLYGDYRFTPIENDYLTSYNGQSNLDGTELKTSIYSLHIAGTNGEDAGLFKTFGNGTTTSEIKNVTLTGVKISQGENVGVLIGKADGDVTIEDCSVYLSSRQGDLEDIATQENAKDVTPWIKGDTVGGLIGSSTADVTIANSFAATVLKSSSTSGIAGGLIGQVGGKVTANTVYADCYLLADQTGGLFGDAAGSADINIENFYAVGYQVGSTEEAGIVPGAINSATNGYCAVDFESANENENVTKYSTAESAGSMSKVYYLTGNTNLNISTKTSYEELSKNEQDGVILLSADHFTTSSGGASYPYNLMDQGLSTYSYPRLTDLDHYGDWQAEFESGKLVYYEKYEGDSYGFQGANVGALSNDKTVVGDGYAIAYTKDTLPTNDPEIKLTYGNIKTSLTIDGNKMVTVTNKGETYYLQALPQTVVNPTLDNTVEKFYQEITIESDGTKDTYYYNPYFAKTIVESDTAPTKAPDTISIRSPRQLYALSLYYKKYAEETKNSAYNQELDLDYTKYAWASYTTWGSTFSQSPIDADKGFIANYNGEYHTITGLSITSSQAATGLFGTIGKDGVVRNLFLTGRVGTEKVTRTTDVSDIENVVTGSKRSSQVGALAGINQGTISNCAVSGYEMTYYGYNSNKAYIGGMVGENQGTIRYSSADAAGITLTSYDATAYVGGMVGRNSGSIRSSYATGLIKILQARSATVWAAGFVGNNTDGTTNRCYAATAITAAGEAEVYGFGRVGGSVADCYYLNGGTYEYAGEIYAYNTASNEYASKAAGTAKTGDELESKSLRDFGAAKESYNHDQTSGDNYIYPAVVTMNGQKVHFGNWPIQKQIGAAGIFYWEHEESGSNSGYHISYIGYDDGKEISDSTLCQQHDDGGVITSYGYGYFYKTGTTEPTLTATNCNKGNKNTDAEKALHAQMGEYQFVAYETGEDDSKLHTTSFTKNVTWTLKAPNEDGESNVYTFSVCPFFANSMSMDSVKLAGQNTTSFDNAKPGEKENTYEIRSEAQLQFMNWNSAMQTATYSITSGNYDKSSGSTKIRDRYPYLLSGSPSSVPSIPKSDAMLYWNQSHDIDAYKENGNKNKDFTPIGSMYDTGYNDANAQPYVAFFPYIYDGQSYTIKNISIHSTNQAIGLFGVTAGAQLKNIVMYSDRGNEIVNETNGTGWYTMGGLAGFAGSRRSSYNSQTDSSFTNCTVSGYTIIDKRDNTPGWGGGNVGGLVGMTNMDITNCSSVNDINLSIGYNETYKNLRVGGIAGVCRAVINSCYAGGSIVSNVTTNDTGDCNSACIWVGGIAGGIVVRNTGKLADLFGFVDRSIIVSNCYSYVDLPAGPKTRGQTGYNHVRASMSIASNGEMMAPNEWFIKGDVPVRTARIYNCYALASAVEDTTDYKNYADSKSFNGKDINALDTSGDQVLVYNGSSSLYLTYEQMAASMIDDLNTTVTATYDYKLSGGNTRQATVTETGHFDTVTTKEKGVTITGKYSYPGNDEELQGSDYPFPTVLTQTDIFGSTVNVHYGQWPKYGIFWENSSVDFDLFANRKTATSGTDIGKAESLYTVKLRLYEVSETLEESNIIFTDDEGAELNDSPLEVYEISGLETDETSSYYEVTFKGLKSGTAFVHATLGGKEAEMEVNVTSDMTIKVTTEDGEDQVTLNAGEEKNVALTFYSTNTDGTEKQIIPAKDKLTWNVTIKSGEDYVLCDHDTVKYDTSTGELKVTLTGKTIDTLSDADALVSVSCTYQYGGEGETLEKSADIMVTVKSPDFAYLSYEDESNGYRFSQTTDTSQNKTDIAKLADSFSGDGIAIRNTYAGLTDVTLDAISLEVGGVTYTPNATSGEVYNGSDLLATITLGTAKEDTENGYTFYPLTVSDLTTNATLHLKLRDDVTLSVTIPASSTAGTEAATSSDDSDNDSSTRKNSTNTAASLFDISDGDRKKDEADE